MEIEIDDVIDRLLQAFRRHGLPPPSDPVTDSDLSAVQDAVAPLRLPAELVAVWTHFQDGTAGMVDGFDLLPATSALEVWHEDVATWPRCLFPIAYGSHAFRWVELDGPDDVDGGAVWGGEYTSPEMDLIAPTLAGLLAAVADGWDAGLFRLEQWQPIKDLDAWRELLAKRFPNRPRVNGWERLEWPARWQVHSGLDVRDANPRGASTTIRALRNEARASIGRRATIAGRVVSLMGTGEGSRVTVDDGTGELEVWMPAECDPFKAVRKRANVELDVTLQHAQPRRAEIDRIHGQVTHAVASGDIEAAKALALGLPAFLDPAQIEAIATAARPGSIHVE